MVEKMTRLYDGYHFYPYSEGVFNPFSVLNACKSKILSNFWFQTGTPTYPVGLLQQSDYDLRLLTDGVEVTSSAFSEYRADARNPLPMIYQSGYLTIKGYDKEVGLYTFGFPNDEVRYGFLNFLHERHYQAIFHVVFTLLGQFIRSEVRSSRGRADAVVTTPDAINALIHRKEFSDETTICYPDMETFADEVIAEVMKKMNAGMML